MVKLSDRFRILGKPGIEGGKVVFPIAAAHPIPASLGESGYFPVGIVQVHVAALVIPGDFFTGDGDKLAVLVVPVGGFMQKAPVIGQGVLDVGQIIVPVSVVQTDVVVCHAEKVQRGGLSDVLVSVLRELYAVASGKYGNAPGPCRGVSPYRLCFAAVGQVVRLGGGLERNQNGDSERRQQSGCCAF